MNIIIVSENTSTVTNETSTDLDTVRLFIAKTYNYIPVEATLRAESEEDGLTVSHEYLASIIPAPSLNKKEYLAYTMTSRCAIPLLEYTLTLTETAHTNPLTLSPKITLNNQLADEHVPIMIIGRNIGTINTPIIAGDRRSQEFTFYIQKKYDGVSFFDDTKEFWADYIPVDFKPPEEFPDLEFYSSRISEIHEVVLEDMEGDWLSLKWEVPDEAMAKVGTVKFAISILEKTENGTYPYVWQTAPSSFKVSPALGKRMALPIDPADDVTAITELINDVEELKTTTSSLNELMGYQADTDSNNDTEVYVGGGGAPIDTEGES